MEIKNNTSVLNESTWELVCSVTEINRKRKDLGFKERLNRKTKNQKSIHNVDKLIKDQQTSSLNEKVEELRINSAAVNEALANMKDSLEEIKQDIKDLKRR